MLGFFCMSSPSQLLFWICIWPEDNSVIQALSGPVSSGFFTKKLLICKCPHLSYLAWSNQWSPSYLLFSNRSFTTIAEDQFLFKGTCTILSHLVFSMWVHTFENLNDQGQLNLITKSHCQNPKILTSLQLKSQVIPGLHTPQIFEQRGWAWGLKLKSKFVLMLFSCLDTFYVFDTQIAGIIEVFADCRLNLYFAWFQER